MALWVIGYEKKKLIIIKKKVFIRFVVDVGIGIDCVCIGKLNEC